MMPNKRIKGLRCLGAPVWDYSGKIVAALSIAGPAFRLTEGRIPAVSRAVLAAARHLSEELGHHALRSINVRVGT